MALSITKNGLWSRRIRRSVGERKISPGGAIESAGDGGIIQRILGVGRRLIGFLSNVVGFVTWSFTRVFGWMVERFMELRTFDWNASDAEIFNMIRSNNLSLAAVYGGSAGSIAGWFTVLSVGAGLGMIFPVIGGKMLAAAIANNVTEEGLEEILSTLRASFGQTIGTVSRNAALMTYVGLRRFIKRPGILDRIFGSEAAQTIRENWGAPGGESWTIAEAIEEKIEEIPNDFARIFTEEFLEEFEESFIEGGYIVAGTLDEFWIANQQGHKAAQGPERKILLTPDNRANDETLLLQGKQNGLIPIVRQTLANHQLVYNRDMGQIVGQPAVDWYRANFQRRRLTIRFRSKERPPWRNDDGTRLKEATYSIPDFKTSATWRKIKRAARAYNWGRFRATANLDNGRQMAVYGGSEREAKDKLYDLLELSDANIVTLSITEEVLRNHALRKETTKMYPHSATLLVRRGSVDLNGRTDLEGNTFDEHVDTFALWVDDEPEDMPEFL